MLVSVMGKAVQGWDMRRKGKRSIGGVTPGAPWEAGVKAAWKVCGAWNVALPEVVVWCALLLRVCSSVSLWCDDVLVSGNSAVQVLIYRNFFFSRFRISIFSLPWTCERCDGVQ